METPSVVTGTGGVSSTGGTPVEKKCELPLSPVTRIAKATGAERISKPAIKTIANATEVYISELVKRALNVAHADGRKTITDKDIEIAAGGMKK